MKKEPDNFKNFKVITYPNIKTKGFYEWQLKPVELIINVSFSIVAAETTGKKSDFQDKLKQFDQLNIDKCIKKNLKVNGWKYSGSRYTFGHDVSQINPRHKVSSLGLDLYFTQQDEETDIELSYEIIAAKVAALDVFQSTPYFVVRPNRK